MAGASPPEAEAAAVQQAQNQESGANRADCSSAPDPHSHIDLHLDKDCGLFGTTAVAERRFRRGGWLLSTRKRDSERMLKPRFKAFGIPGLMRQITFTQLLVGTQGIQIAFGPADDSLINGRRDRRDVRISGYERDCHHDENGQLTSVRHASIRRNALGDWRLG